MRITYPDFEEFLYAQCDTDDVERIEQWVENLDNDELMEYANKYGQKMAEIAITNIQNELLKEIK